MPDLEQCEKCVHYFAFYCSLQQLNLDCDDFASLILYLNLTEVHTKSFKCQTCIFNNLQMV